MAFGASGLAVVGSARTSGAHRARRPGPAPAGRRHVPDPCGPAPGATARLPPRGHGAHARCARPRRAAHRIRRQPTGGVLLHRRPLPQLPPLRARGVGAMSAFELRALLADASQNGSYFIDMRDRGGLDEVARELGHAVAAIDLAGCRDKDDVLRSEEHTSELQSLMRISYAFFCL